MDSIQKWAMLIPLIFWAGASQSKEIKFGDLEKLVEQNNQKLKSLNHIVEGEEIKTGYLIRSFLPEVKLYAGQEEFRSDALGDQSSSFYGARVSANIYRGNGDYWESEKRKADVSLAKIQRRLSLKELIFEAKKSYLSLAEAKKVEAILTDGLSKVKGVASKVRRKVRSGVISRSDLTSLSLASVGFEEDIREIRRSVAIEKGRLGAILSIPDIKIGDIDGGVLSLKSDDSESLSSEAEILLVKQGRIKAATLENESKVHSSERLPSIGLFADYGRRPFSGRELAQNSDRDEWKAGVQVTWQIGSLLEKGRQAKSSSLHALGATQLSQYRSEEIKGHISALFQKNELLVESIKGLEKEIGLSQNYFSQISSEYLRGIKSTSDLISAFSQLLKLKKRRIRLLAQRSLAQAEIEKLAGE